jgi:hypothetical protein
MEKPRETKICLENVFTESSLVSSVAWFLCRIIENMIFRSINFCNRGIRSLKNASNVGMLLFPFGNLSHTSILYYDVLFVIKEFE